MEKADILELAIRCLEGKDNTENDTSSCLERDNNRRTQQRRPLAQLSENTTQSAVETKRELEVTPIRTKSFLTTTLRTDLTGDENMSSTRGGQPRAELKPLLNHPIRSFRKCNRRNVITRVNTPYQVSYDTSSKLQPSSLNPIWRPWTL